MIDWLFSTEGFRPRKDCGTWSPELIWLHVGSDLLIWLAYLSIPMVLGYFARQKGVPFYRLFWLFAAFILACGFTHFIDALMFERPMYHLSGVVKAITAAVSWMTVIALVPAVPRIMSALSRAKEVGWVEPDDRPDARGWVLRYLVAAVAAVLALLVRGAFDPLLEGSTALVVPLLAVVFVAWQCGFGPAVAALVVSVVGVAFFFLEPRNSLVVEHLGDQLAVGLFLFCGFTCALLGEAQRRAGRRAERNLAATRAKERELEAEIARREQVMADLAAAQRKSAEALALLDSIFKAAPVGLSVHDADLRFVRVNDALARMNGFPADAHIGRTGPELIPGLKDAIEPVLRRVQETGAPVTDVEIAGETPAGGGRRHWLASYFPVEVPGGDRVGVGAVVTDVTDRKRAEEAVRASERFLRNVLDSMATVVGVTTPDGVLTQVNRAALEVSGLRPADVLGKPLADAPLWADDPDAQAQLREAVRRAAAGVASRYDADVRAAGGRRVTLDFMLSPMTDDRGRVTHLIPSGIDISDRKRAEEAMRESEARFRSLADSAPVLIWVTGPDRGVVYVNKPWLDFTGRTVAQEYGTGWADGVHPDDLGRVLDVRADRAAAREPFELEYRLRRHDGAYRWVLDRGLPRFAAGAFVGYIGTCLDITDRKEAVERLRQEEEQFRTLADNMSQFAWTTDETGWINWYNRRWFEYTGTTFDAMQGWGWKAVHHPDHVNRVVAKFARHVAAGEPWEDTFPLRGRDGQYRWFLSRAVPIRDADGQVVRWFGTNTDITDRMDAEQALREARDELESRVEQRTAELARERGFLRAVLENIEDGIVACDADGVLTLFNRATVRLHGLPAEPLPPDRWADHYDLYQADGKTRLRTAEVPLFRALAGEHVQGAEMVIAPKGQPPRTLVASGQAIHDAAGHKLGAVVSMHDVTERRQAERVLAAASDELRRSNEELEKFAYVASHDLQEPLRKIQAFGDRLRTKFAATLGDQGTDYLERMMASAGRMRSLINDLLAFSRVTTKGQPFAPVDLAGVLDGVLSDLEARLSQTQGVVEVGALPTIEADPLQMRQLFQNLIGNALKFHKPEVPPVVTIGSEVLPPADGDEIPRFRLTVTDNGIGFDEKYLDRIFQVFQRLHGRTEYEGTGVGLAICRKIVERHGGEITAESRPGHGATFVVTLPARQPSASPTTVDA